MAFTVQTFKGLNNMPKKGENMKAVAAKSRKEEKQTAEKAKKEKEVEDSLWKDDDKHLAKKQVIIFTDIRNS